MLWMRKKRGERQLLELRIAEELRFTKVDDVGNAVVLLRLHLVDARRNGQREFLILYGEDHLPLCPSASKKESADVVNLIPQAREAHAITPPHSY